MTDKKAADVFAAESGRKEIIWVGTPLPAVVAEFPAAVHVRVDAYNGSAAPRVIVPTPDGYYWQIELARPAVMINSLQKVLLPDKPISHRHFAMGNAVC